MCGNRNGGKVFQVEETIRGTQVRKQRASLEDSEYSSLAKRVRYVKADEGGGRMIMSVAKAR